MWDCNCSLVPDIVSELKPEWFLTIWRNWLISVFVLFCFRAMQLFIWCVWPSAVIGHWIKVDFNTAGMRHEERIWTKEREGNNKRNLLQSNIWNLKIFETHNYWGQQFFPLLHPFQLSRWVFLPFWESDFWLYSFYPLRNLTDLLSPLLFDNPSDYRFTICWVLHSPPTSPATGFDGSMDLMSENT